MKREVIPLLHIEVSIERRRTIGYAIIMDERGIGEMHVEYIHDLQHAIIHKLEVDLDFRRQRNGSFAVGWLIAHTPYLVGTLYEWESAYEFWGDMRQKFKGRMLPPPK